MSKNALNDERTKTAKDIKDLKTKYEKEIQKRIAINKIHQDANILFDYNGMLPHYKPDFKTINDYLADLNAFKAYLIKELQKDGFMDAQNAIDTVIYVNQIDKLFPLAQMLSFIKTKFEPAYGLGNVKFHVFKTYFDKLIVDLQDPDAFWYPDPSQLINDTDNDKDDDSSDDNRNNNRNESTSTNEVKQEPTTSQPKQTQQRPTKSSTSQSKQERLNTLKQQQMNSQARKAHIDTKQDYGQDKKAKNLIPQKRERMEDTNVNTKKQKLRPSSREVQGDIIRLRNQLGLSAKDYPANKRNSQNIETLNKLKELSGTAMEVDDAMEGTALPRRRGRPQKKMKGGALYSQKPNTRWYGNVTQTQDKFTPFGTKLIQAEQFQNDNIVCLYNNCGVLDKNFPVRKVNQDFASVLRDMLNGKAPNFDTLNKLSDEDKVYLNQLLRKTKQHGYYSVPMPDKDNITKHHERLEWTLGQIRDGNNSPDIVKELKTKLLWFRNQNMMPRSQINQILYELNDLGY